jgi:hypothetical protein
MAIKKRKILHSAKSVITPLHPRRSRNPPAQRLNPFNAAAWCGVFPNTPEILCASNVRCVTNE